MITNQHTARLGILINDDPGNYDLVRKDSGPVLRSLGRFERWLMRQTSPSAFKVRGDFVAVDCLVEALLREGSMSSYELFTHPTSVANVERRARDHWQCDLSRVHVNATDTLLTNNTGFSLATMLSPTLAMATPFELRDAIPSGVIPVACLTHGLSMPDMPYNTVLRLLLANTYSCDSIICTSRASLRAMSSMIEHVREQFSRDCGVALQSHVRLDCLPLCVDTDRLVPKNKLASRAKLGIPQAATVLLFAGRISSLKADLYPLLTIFKALIEKNTAHKLVLVIAGTKEEPYATGVRQLIRLYSLDKHVCIVSDFTDNLKCDIYSTADIFVAPADSMQESFGLSPIEAMSCGVPQVAADWDGYRDTIVHTETGFLIPTYWTECDRDVNATSLLFGPQYDHQSLGQSVAIDQGIFQSSLQLLIDNPGLRFDMGDRSRKHALKMYSYRAVAVQYEELCRELSSIASADVKRKPSKSFSKPNYWKFFGGYASTTLDERTTLELTSLYDEEHGKLFLSLLSKPGKFGQIVDPELLKAAIKYFRQNEEMQTPLRQHSKRGITMASLVNSLCVNKYYHHDFVVRNVMWLIKQGFVRVS